MQVDITKHFNKTNPAASLFVVKFADSELPVFKEDRKDGHVRYGAEDDYPDYLLQLLNKSSKHNAIVGGKSKYIFGKGLKSMSEDAAAQAWIDCCNTSGESLNEIVSKSIRDIETFGGFYWQILTDKLGNITSIYHITFSKIRTNESRTRFYFKRHGWRGTKALKETPQEFIKYKAGAAGNFIYSYREYRQGMDIYPLPDYVPAINYIESDYHISKHTLQNAKNGFNASKMVSFFNGEPENDDEKRDIEKALNQKFTGSEGSKILITFNNSVDQKPEVQDLGSSDLTKEDFSVIDNLVGGNIYAAHGITSPILFGIQEPGKLGGSTELKTSFDIFKVTYVSFKQINIEEQVNYFAKIKGLKDDLCLQDVDPISIPFDDATLLQVAPVQWFWEKLGIKASDYPDALPATTTSKVPQPGQAATPVGAPKEQMATNENIRNLTGRQWQNLERILKKFATGRLSRPQAALMLKTGIGLTDEEINQFLDNPGQFIAAFMVFNEEDFTEQQVADMFGECGEGREVFTLLSTKNVKHLDFEAEEWEMNEAFAITIGAGKANDLDTRVLQAISANTSITVTDLANILVSDEVAINASIARLETAGYLTITQKIKTGSPVTVYKVLKPATDLVDKGTKIPQVSVKYSYEIGPGNGAEIIPGTRPFCRKLIQLNRLYSRTDIQNISARVGYSVFDRRGGFWNQGNGEVSPSCRHVWKAHLVMKKES